LQGKNSLSPSVHAGACAVLDLDRLLLVGTDTVDSPPPCLSDNKENAVLGRKIRPGRRDGLLGRQLPPNQSPDERRASVNITLWRFEASHTMRVRSAGPFCVKMFNSLQASSDQLFA